MFVLLLACRPSAVVGTPSPPIVQATAETGDSDERTWVQISAWPCALDSEGFVQCWGGSDGVNGIAALPSNPEPVTTFRVHPLNAMGILPSGRITSWFCPPGEAECYPPVDVVALDVSTGCAWLENHEVVCWDEGVPHGPPGLIRNFASLGPVGAVSLSYDFVARMDDAGGIFFQEQLEPADIVAVDHFGRSFCTLDAEGRVECHGSPSWWEDTPPPPVFPNPPYTAIDGDTFAFCAQRADHVLECHNGETFDFGPLRDFAVGNRGYLVDEGFAFTDPIRIRPTFDGPFELCVITETNAIECVGPPQFTPELLTNLPN